MHTYEPLDIEDGLPDIPPIESYQFRGATDVVSLARVDPTPVVHEGDVEAFLMIRLELRSIGVHLLDAVIFDDQSHWWSLHELTSGTTMWMPPLAMADADRP